MNVRLDEARDDEPSAEVLARRVGAEPWHDGGEASVAHTDIDQLLLIARYAGVPEDVVQAHAQALPTASSLPLAACQRRAILVGEGEIPGAVGRKPLAPARRIAWEAAIGRIDAPPAPYAADALPAGPVATGRPLPSTPHSTQEPS